MHKVLSKGWEILRILLLVIQLLAKTPVVTFDSPVTDLILEQSKP